MSNGFAGQLRKQSLVIEDYYRVSVEPPDAQVETGLPLANALDGSREQAGVDPTPGQDSSYLSEGEGPAQWLAAPKVDPNHGDTLSMESADDTSDSEGEWKRRHARSLLWHQVILDCLCFSVNHDRCTQAAANTMGT